MWLTGRDPDLLATVSANVSVARVDHMLQASVKRLGPQYCRIARSDGLVWESRMATSMIDRMVELSTDLERLVRADGRT